MSRRIAVSVVLVLVVGSSAFGSLLQGQGYALGTDNMIHLTQGDQAGQSSQNLLIDMSQSAEGSGLAMISASAYGVSSQGGSGLGALGMIGVGRVHAVSIGGLGGSVMPVAPLAGGSATLQLAKARLNALTLMAN